MAKRAAKHSPLDTSFSGDERIVVLHGSETFLHVDLTNRLCRAIADKNNREFETVRFEGKNAQLADVLDELRSFGLMQQHKIAVVTEADEFVKKHRDALQRYAEAPVDTATLLLRAGKWNKGNLDKLITKVGLIVKCDSPSTAETQKWLIQRASDVYETKLDRTAASMLIEHLGCSLGMLDAEIGKLAVGGTVTAERVRELTSTVSDEQAWEIQSALLSGKPRQAVELLHELLGLAGRDAVPIGWAVIDLSRKLHHAAAMLAAGQTDKEICGTLKIWPWDRQKPFMAAARRLGVHHAAAMMAMAIETDRRSKSGSGVPAHNLERLCVRFCAALA